MVPDTNYTVTIETMLDVDSLTIDTFARLHFMTLLLPTSPLHLETCPRDYNQWLLIGSHPLDKVRAM